MEWTGIWNSEAGMRGWRFAGGALATTLDADEARAAAGQAPSDRILIAGAEGVPPETLPAHLMPEQLLSGAEALVLPGLEQAKPVHRIDGGRLPAIGFMALNDGWDGVICLPGAITHWISVSAGEVIFVQSAASLQIAAAFGLEPGAADADAVSEGLSQPARLATALRSASLSGDDDTARGWLLGAELAATRALWLGQQVAVLGDGPATAAYRAALEAQGVPVTVGSAAAMAEKGMAALGARFGLAG